MKREPSVAESVRPSHHIQEVAHHFLQSAGPPADPAASSTDAGTIVYRVPAAARHFAVAALEGELASWVAAQLAMTSASVAPVSGSPVPPPRVFLREWGRPVDSALAAVRRAIGDQSSPETAVEAPSPAEVFRSAPAAQGRGAQRGCPGPAGGMELDCSGSAGESIARTLRPQISWFHLGAATPDRLAELETAAMWCRGAGCPLGGKDGLVWCLTETGATSWQAAYALGRLAVVMEPTQIKILLFLDEPPDRQRRLARERSPGTGQVTRPFRPRKWP